MKLHAIVEASRTMAATRSRKAKAAAIAGVLSQAAEAGPSQATAADVGLTVAFLSGQTRQDRIGAGWRTLAALNAAPAQVPMLEVSEVDAAFEAAAGLEGAGSTTARTQTLRALFECATKDEQEFLFRLLTGEIRHGALEGVMVEAIASTADVAAELVRRAFMLAGDLPATAEAALTGGETALKAFRLELGRPIRPMLASTAGAVDEAVTTIGGPHVVEYKLDGARIQVHKHDGQVRIWTRTLREVTASAGELVELVKALPCDQVVLDGETLALTDDGRPRPFQQTQSRFGSTRQEQVKALLLHPYFFDCLHLDGEDLLDAPLHVRRQALHSVAKDHVIPGEIDPDQPERVLEAALAEGHEGVMIKSLDAPYAAGRRGKSWLKVKPVHTLDLIVLGAEWGHGRRRGTLSNLHLGARDPDGGEPVMVGKTFKGLTDELRAWQTTTFQEMAVSRTDAAVFTRPELVVEIALDGALPSTRYPGGVALRFARVVRYRPDKSPAEADTVDAIRALLR